MMVFKSNILLLLHDTKTGPHGRLGKWQMRVLSLGIKLGVGSIWGQFKRDLEMVASIAWASPVSSSPHEFTSMMCVLPRSIHSIPTGHIVLFLQASLLTASLPLFLYPQWHQPMLHVAAQSLSEAQLRIFHFTFQSLQWLPTACRAKSNS